MIPRIDPFAITLVRVRCFRICSNRLCGCCLFQTRINIAHQYLVWSPCSKYMTNTSLTWNGAGIAPRIPAAFFLLPLLYAVSSGYGESWETALGCSFSAHFHQGTTKAKSEEGTLMDQGRGNLGNGTSTFCPPRQEWFEVPANLIQCQAEDCSF